MWLWVYALQANQRVQREKRPIKRKRPTNRFTFFSFLFYNCNSELPIDHFLCLQIKPFRKKWVHFRKPEIVQWKIYLATVLEASEYYWENFAQIHLKFGFVCVNLRISRPQTMHHCAMRWEIATISMKFAICCINKSSTGYRPYVMCEKDARNEIYDGTKIVRTFSQIKFRKRSTMFATRSISSHSEVIEQINK